MDCQLFMPKLFVSLCKLSLAANQKLLSFHSRRDFEEKLFQLEKPHTDGLKGKEIENFMMRPEN